jgi:perosamine synthetase
MRFPVYKPQLGEAERRYVMDCLESTWISSKGAYIDRFERAFGERIGAPHCSSVCNGTVALHLALVALGIGPGDEVITPTFTYVASVNTIVQAGATPVFVDSRADDWHIDLDQVAARVGPRTRAVMAVHLYGSAARVDRLAAFCRERGLFLIEDAAEAFGTTLGGRHVGTFGDIATFSFFGNKTITTGEGGMVVSRDAEVHDRVQRLKNQGVTSPGSYFHDRVAYNYRMTNICAAIGLAQIERADTILEQKARVARAYHRHLSQTPLAFQAVPPDVVSSHWLISALVPRELSRDEVRTRLAEDGIETRPLFHPSHLMPMYADRGGDFPVALALSERGLNLPSYPDLSDDDVALICDRVKTVLR